ncbi:phosphatase PAP2 family protein [Aspergillus undulatus]|uniref:phosphatase PAP2 family protein n=1 Tax=Aspergillus undulatus TaxID=1810928 RepID=UPI003CCDE500
MALAQLKEKAFPAVPRGHARFSIRVFLSYILDWISILAIALIGYGFHKVEPNHMPFSLDDVYFSYPYVEDDTISTAVLVVVSLIAPGVLIAFFCLLFTPGASFDTSDSPSRLLLWRRKIWEWNVGWLGLALACAGAFMATEGLKDLYGKPRPDLLSRCDPDVENIAAYAVGGLGQRLAGAPTLVTWGICRNKAKMVKMDGFVSFPSGHSSFAFAGLTYFSLWLCSKFSISFPYLAHTPLSQNNTPQNRYLVRTQGAAPPIYLIILAFVPWAVAFFISASRWFDYRHHGFDIIFGSVLGMVFAYVGFRLYAPPLERGAGWAWGARAPERAFFKGVGRPGNVGDEGWGFGSGSGSGAGDGFLATMSRARAPPALENGHGHAQGQGQSNWYENGNGHVDLESGRDLAA